MMGLERLIRVQNLRVSGVSTYAGQEIEPGEYYQISSEDQRQSFATDNQLNLDIWVVPAVAAINDGQKNLSAKDGDDWLKLIDFDATPVHLKGSNGSRLSAHVDEFSGVNRARVEALVSTPTRSPLPTITLGSKNIRIKSLTNHVDIHAGYSNVFLKKGKGLFFGFNIYFDNDSVRVRFTIDETNEVFALVLSDIKDLQCEGTPIFDMISHCAGNLMGVTFKNPIPYDKSISIQVQKSSKFKVNINKCIVALTEE